MAVTSEHHWSIFTNHGAVLIHILGNPDATIRRISDDLGLAERTVVGVLQDLRLKGYLHVRKNGRNNHYRVNLDAPMQRPEHEGFTLREFLAHTQDLLQRHLAEVLNEQDCSSEIRSAL